MVSFQRISERSWGALRRALLGLASCVAVACATAARSGPATGEVLAEFEVDTLGVADVSTFKVIRASDSTLVPRVRAILKRATFVPAVKNGVKVRQVVQQPFVVALKP